MTVLPKSQRNPHDYSVRDECARCLEKLLQLAGEQLPDEFQDHIKDVIFTAPKGSSNVVYLPCPFKETEATSVLKAVEACAAAAIADLRFSSKKRRIDIDLERATCFLFSAYLSTVDGMDKANPNVKSKLKGQTRKLRSHSPSRTNKLRHRSAAGTINPVPPVVSQSLPDKACRRVFPSPWILGSNHGAQHDRTGRTSA